MGAKNTRNREVREWKNDAEIQVIGTSREIIEGGQEHRRWHGSLGGQENG
jgi:hypothetical protein